MRQTTAAIALMLVSMGCADGDQTGAPTTTVGRIPTTTSSTVLATSTSTTPPDSALGSSLKTAFGNTVTIYALEDPAKVGYPADDGLKWVAVDAEYCATGTGNRPGTEPLIYRVVTDNNTQAEGMTGRKPDYLRVAQLQQGECVRGWVTFEIPGTARVVTVMYGPLEDGTSLRWHA